MGVRLCMPPEKCVARVALGHVVADKTERLDEGGPLPEA